MRTMVGMHTIKPTAAACSRQIGSSAESHAIYPPRIFYSRNQVDFIYFVFCCCLCCSWCSYFCWFFPHPGVHALLLLLWLFPNANGLQHKRPKSKLNKILLSTIYIYHDEMLVVAVSRLQGTTWTLVINRWRRGCFFGRQLSSIAITGSYIVAH